MQTIHSNSRAKSRQPMLQNCRGFTLIELMVVVTIILLLAVMTASAINLTISGDKVRAGSRQVQSFLSGARDRAIYSREPRGVRFMLDPTNNRTVSSMVFIGPTDPWTQGLVRLERLDVNGDMSADSPGSAAFVLGGYDDTNNPTDWLNLYKQGLIYNGTRVKIPNDDTGQWYTITTDLLASGASPYPRLHLTTAYQGPGQPNQNSTSVEALAQDAGRKTYLLELPPAILPNQEVVLMPKGSVIHLDRCSNNVEQIDAATPASGRGNKLPDFWKYSPSSAGDPSGFDYTSRLDVMFSPRGIVVGSAAQRGIIHFYIADQKDADRDRLYWSSPTAYPTNSALEIGAWSSAALSSDPSNMNIGYERGDHVLLSVFTRTGAISTHHIYSNADPLRFAETGEVAGK